MHACTRKLAGFNQLSANVQSKSFSPQIVRARVRVCVQAKTVKETMDKKFAPNWHCFIGQVCVIDIQRMSVVCVYNSVCRIALHPHLHVCMNSYTRTHKHLSLYLTLSCPHARTHSTRTRTCTRTRTHINAHTHKHTRIHAHKLPHIHTSSHTCAPWHAHARMRTHILTQNSSDTYAHPRDCVHACASYHNIVTIYLSLIFFCCNLFSHNVPTHYNKCYT